MKELETSLLREKFIIHEPGAGKGKARDSIVALSNRMAVPLYSEKNQSTETFVIRAQNMHGCARMAARLAFSFEQTGSLIQRAKPYDWNAAWTSVVNDYEQAFNPQRWVAVYHQGKMIFQAGIHHALLDVIEKCNESNPEDYAHAIVLAENVFKQAGKEVRIEYKDNVALSVHMGETQGRIGAIIRGPNRTTTFHFSTTAHEGKRLSVPLCLSGAASFLEGIQLAFMVGFNEEKIRRGMIEHGSKEERQTGEARKRLARLNAEITDMENSCEVHYRPERPEFNHILIEAEKQAQKILASA